jgi:hypothetical protein
MRRIHEYIREFINFDVSRLKDFYPIPQHRMKLMLGFFRKGNMY